MPTAIKVENLSKAYQLGKIGTGTVSRDLERWWATKIRGKEDPFLKIGETNDRSVKGSSDIVWSLKDMNFEIGMGDAVGIIGKNGAGKSTLLKILSRVTAPTAGRVHIRGRVASLLEVGTGFHPELTGKENIYLNGAILGMRKKEITRKLDEIIAFSGVERYIDTPVKRYSSGMYVRLAFAVAAHLESEIMIVDEVLAVGDAEFQKKCLGKMGEVSKGEGRTVIFVSHNMSAVNNLCNFGIVLKNGQMDFSGNIQNAVQHYLKQYSEENTHVQYDAQNAPGNEYGRLREVKIEGQNKKEVIRLDESIEINFNIQLDHSIKNKILDLTFHLRDEMGHLVFVAATGLDENTTAQFRGKCKCTIPSNLLNTGTYNIHRLLVVKNKGTVLVEFKDVAQFEVIDKVEQQLGWAGKKEGVVRPHLNWENL